MAFDPKNVQILLVEDTAVMRKIEIKTLKTLGFDGIVEAVDGDEAIGILQGDRQVDRQAGVFPVEPDTGIQHTVHQPRLGRGLCRPVQQVEQQFPGFPPPFVDLGDFGEDDLEQACLSEQLERSARRAAAARWTATVLLPTPPLPPVTAITLTGSGLIIRRKPVAWSSIGSDACMFTHSSIGISHVFLSRFFFQHIDQFERLFHQRTSLGGMQVLGYPLTIGHKSQWQSGIDQG